MMKNLGSESATVECDHNSVVIKCRLQCCVCATWLEGVGGYGNPHNPEGPCPICGAPLEDCALFED